MLTWADLVVGAQLLAKLPFFLRRRVSLEQAQATLADRLEQRQADFLALVRSSVYAQPTSPYRALLRLAGCEYGDLTRLVAAEGVEGALRVLFRQGVYLTVEEFKGRRAAVRGSASVEVTPDLLRNPAATITVPRYSSGSRGPRTAAPYDLTHIRERAVGVRLYLEARDGVGWQHATWEAPSGSAVVHLLEYSLAGAAMGRWFTPISPVAPGLHPRYRWIGEVLRLGGWLAGQALPRPEYAPLDAPVLIAGWMSDLLRRGGTPHLFTFPSSAARLCRAAQVAGLDLHGARFTVVGEPLTPARQAAIRQAGAEAIPRYGSTEASSIGSGCLAPEVPDDMHLLEDQLAVIQPEADGALAGLPDQALLLSTLRVSSPVIMLNVSSGDQARLTRRSCGCPMERFGWRTHLYAVRSFEKLTAGGMTFLDTDVIRVLEETLPRRFGGGPTDYQLVEDEAVDGQIVVRLLVHPAVGPVPDEALAEAFLRAIGGDTDADELMAAQWRQTGLPLIERRAPYVAGTGKIQHLHQHRRS